MVSIVLIRSWLIVTQNVLSETFNIVVYVVVVMFVSDIVFLEVILLTIKALVSNWGVVEMLLE